jgi:hypothetical protein
LTKFRSTPRNFWFGPCHFEGNAKRKARVENTTGTIAVGIADLGCTGPV